MSKIGRMPIDIGGAEVQISNGEVRYKGKLTEGVHRLDPNLEATLDGKVLSIRPKKMTRDTNRLWGLHRALLANKIKGAESGFERVLQIKGLGYKARHVGKSLELSLGFSHKIEYAIPEDVTIEVDKSGQVITVKSPFKDALGQACADIRFYRPPEPYKGTGIRYRDEEIRRKEGKKAKA